MALRGELSWIARTLPGGLDPAWTLVHRFVRPLPSPAYEARLRRELRLIHRLGFHESLLQAQPAPPARRRAAPPAGRPRPPPPATPPWLPHHLRIAFVS